MSRKPRAQMIASPASWLLLGLLGACSPADPGGELGATPDANHTQAQPSVTADATVSSASRDPGGDASPAVRVDSDAGRPAADASSGAAGPFDATDASRMDSDSGRPVADASNEASAPLDAAATADSGLSRDAGGGAGQPGGSEDAGPRMPMFQKTRCIDPSKVKADSELNFPCDGVDVWVVVPRQCMTQACGLVFNIHGGGMGDHVTMDEATNMIALGSRADYIVVHPHKGTWSVASDKDVVFGFMQQVIQAFDVDRKRVHSTGYSQGGQISWALGCEHADVIASIAPAEEINRVSDCWKTSKRPARELPVLFAYGKQDSIGGGYAAARETVAQFVAGHRMMGPETVAGAEGSKYWRQRWTSSSGNVLEFISQDYSSTGVLGVLAGHCLPMSTGKTFVSCSLPVDYDWGEEVIRFFRAHPMP